MSLGKTVYSILLQSTQLQNGLPSINKAVLRACALYAAQLLWNIPGGLEWFSVCTVRARGRRSCERFGGYKTINRISLPLPYQVSTSPYYKKKCFIKRKICMLFLSCPDSVHLLSFMTNAVMFI